ncbi:putative cap binding protein [Schistosoma mansoni]|uniref:putative cap binding protein n=1 Tax=Schistosoma mansoni TaxID=6183 RepID=UPI00022DC868|nr:putative cap binding protein [Schistosoma mansoni]|eukprot:XP_018653935.1 putative cap binding protein [Schistosoma mansoni]
MTLESNTSRLQAVFYSLNCRLIKLKCQYCFNTLLLQTFNSLLFLLSCRFIEWFSYHLSNYQLQWSWKEWSSSLTLDPMSPQKRLITETLCRLIR